MAQLPVAVDHTAIRGGEMKPARSWDAVDELRSRDVAAHQPKPCLTCFDQGDAVGCPSRRICRRRARRTCRRVDSSSRSPGHAVVEVANAGRGDAPSLNRRFRTHRLGLVLFGGKQLPRGRGRCGGTRASSQPKLRMTGSYDRVFNCRRRSLSRGAVGEASTAPPVELARG